MCSTGIGGVYNNCGEFLLIILLIFLRLAFPPASLMLILISAIGEADSLALVAVARIGMRLLLCLCKFRRIEPISSIPSGEPIRLIELDEDTVYALWNEANRSHNFHKSTTSIGDFDPVTNPQKNFHCSFSFGGIAPPLLLCRYSSLWML